MKSFLTILLVVSVFAFGFDLFHVVYHLSKDPSLWNLEGVPAKFLIKIFWLLIPCAFLLKRKKWISYLPGVCFFLFLANPVAQASKSSACQHARELLVKSGTARDAEEGFLGQIKLKPPYGSFPSDMDQIAWWGQFKPFEFWESPEFQAVWINPDGQEMLRHKFKGEACALAKTYIYSEPLPRGQLQGGIWKVVVTCEDYLIDKQSFAILPSPGSVQSGSDAAVQSKDTAMIWASDKVK